MRNTFYLWWPILPWPKTVFVSIEKSDNLFANLFHKKVFQSVFDWIPSFYTIRKDNDSFARQMVPCWVISKGKKTFYVVKRRCSFLANGQFTNVKKIILLCRISNSAYSPVQATFFCVSSRAVSFDTFIYTCRATLILLLTHFLMLGECFWYL